VITAGSIGLTSRLKRLQVDDDLGGQHDRIDRRVRVGAVAALALDGHVHRIDVGQRRPLAARHRAVRPLAVAVQRQANVGLAESLVQAVVEHHLGALADLLGRLRDEDQRPLPAVLQDGQDARRADQAGHVDVVAAGVHDAHLLAALVTRLHLAGVTQPRLLDQGQRVGVAADQDGRPVAVAVGADDAVAAHLLGDGEAGLAQLFRHAGGRARLLQGQLGRGVQVLVQRFEALVLGGEAFLDLGDVGLRAGGRRGIPGRRRGVAGASLAGRQRQQAQPQGDGRGPGHEAGVGGQVAHEAALR